jgi:DUF438 domain-containing protein
VTELEYKNLLIIRGGLHMQINLINEMIGEYILNKYTPPDHIREVYETSNKNFVAALKAYRDHVEKEFNEKLGLSECKFVVERYLGRPM